MVPLLTFEFRTLLKTVLHFFFFFFNFIFIFLQNNKTIHKLKDCKKAYNSANGQIIIYSNVRIKCYSKIVLTKIVVYFNSFPRMGLAESLSLYDQAPNLVEVRKSEIHNTAMNFKILKNYI